MMAVVTQREQLILKHYALVHQIARKMASRYPACVDLDDLISIGTVGLIDAADRYDESLNVNFGSYARIRIQGSIIDALRKLDWVPRIIRTRQRMFFDVQQALEKRFFRSPSQIEIAQFLERLGVKNFASFQREAHVSTVVSTEEARSDTEHRLGDTLRSTNSLPDHNVEKLLFKERLMKVINEMSERDRNIVLLYYFEGHSLRAIGQRLGVTESRVCQLHRRIRNKMRDELSTHRIDIAA